MININGKDYKINLDIRLGTEKLMRLVYANPENPKNPKYLDIVLKDLLIPSPTDKEIFNFRLSDREKIFKLFAEESSKTDADFKKKRST